MRRGRSAAQSAWRLVGATHKLRSSSVYAQILAAVGSFAIAAVVIVFTARPKASTLTPLLLGYAAGLLVLGLISSLAGAFNFAAIGAEKELTPNLVASTV